MAVTPETTTRRRGRSSAPPGEPRSPGAGGLGLLKSVLTIREGSIIVVTIVAIIYFGVTTKTFFTGHSFTLLLPFFAPYAIIGAGEVFLMINGEIDLSVGGTYLIAPFIMYEFAQAGLGTIGSLVITMIVMLVIGVINGYLVAVIKINSFVATLGTLFALSGLTLIISHSTQITPVGTTILGSSTYESVFGGGTYSELFWALGIVIVLQIVLSYTKWGLYTVAVGGNRLGAQEAGINESRNMMSNFAVCALLGGFTGVLQANLTTSATPDPTTSMQILFLAIAAAVIGGTLLVGGSGTVVGALIGALFLGIMYDGLALKSVNSTYVYLYLGIAILVAMTINMYVARFRGRAGLG